MMPPPAITVCTLEREPSFVQDTLKDLFAADPTAVEAGPVRILAQSLTADFLGPWASDPRVSVELMDEAEMKECMSRTPAARTTFNGARAFGKALRTHPLIYLEDDIEFADGWYRRTRETAGILNAGSVQGKYAISLYCPHMYGPKALVEYPFTEFVGSQAMYFGPDALNHLATWFYREKKRTEKADRLGVDMAMRDCMHFNNVQFWAAIPSLVQHTGYETIAESVYFHQSPTFLKHVRP